MELFPPGGLCTFTDVLAPPSYSYSLGAYGTPAAAWFAGAYAAAYAYLTPPALYGIGSDSSPPKILKLLLPPGGLCNLIELLSPPSAPIFYSDLIAEPAPPATSAFSKLIS